MKESKVSRIAFVGDHRPRKCGIATFTDNKNIHLIFSDNLYCWNESTLLLRPASSRELVQVSNYGCPVETEAGWLVLSHGVGPMRKYCIGAMLLDRDEPLLKPSQGERERSMPNVVYSCGGFLHGDPYGIADHATGFVTIPLAKILAGMEAVQ